MTINWLLQNVELEKNDRYSGCTEGVKHQLLRHLDVKAWSFSCKVYEFAL